jgi:hypothetical protein
LFNPNIPLELPKNCLFSFVVIPECLYRGSTLNANQRLDDYNSTTLSVTLNSFQGLSFAGGIIRQLQQQIPKQVRNDDM